MSNDTTFCKKNKEEKTKLILNPKLLHCNSLPFYTECVALQNKYIKKNEKRYRFLIQNHC